MHQLNRFVVMTLCLKHTISLADLLQTNHVLSSSVLMLHYFVIPCIRDG